MDKTNPGKPWAAALDAPISNASLVVFRVAFGALMTWQVALLLVSGTVEVMFRHPAMFFTYLGFGWVQPLPGWGLQLQFLLTLLGALGILLGLLHRWSCLLFCAGWTWFWLMDKSLYQNHTYLISLVAFWLAFMPASGRFSLDATLWPKCRAALAPRWNIWLLRFLIGIVYFYAGLAKLYPDWLQGEPMRGHFEKFEWVPLIGPWLDSPAVYLVLVSWGGLLFDLFIVPALLWRPTRLPAFILVLAFHLSNNFLFNIDIFPFLAIAATTVYFDPAWPEGVLAKLGRKARAASKAPEAPPRRSSPRLVAVLGLFVVVQILLPFHHLLYPGDHNWTEEGHKFSWFLMQRTKNGKAVFLVHAKDSGRKFRVDPADYLVPRQVNKLATDPDMILQFAHFLQRELAAEHSGPLAIYAYVQVQLNGRKPAELVRHDVDLTQIERHWGHYAWINPLPPRTAF